MKGIKILRVSKGFSQKELGQLCGLRQERISLLERGLSPNEEELSKLTQALGLKQIGEDDGKTN